MKVVNMLAVETAMGLLVLTNKQTSTLEVKNLLRSVGYHAIQDEVSGMMNDIFHNPENELYTRSTSQDGYFVYTFNEDVNAEVPYPEDFDAPQTATDIAKTVFTPTSPASTLSQMRDLLDDDNDDTTQAPVVQSIAASIPGIQGIQGTTVSKDCTNVFYSIKHVIDNTRLNGNDWCVSAVASAMTNPEYQIFPGYLSRDTVRSRYATTMGVKMQDVRSRRVANVK